MGKNKHKMLGNQKADYVEDFVQIIPKNEENLLKINTGVLPVF